MRTHHPTGTLPLAVMITSSKSQATLESCLDSLTKVLPDNAFGGKGLEQGPTIMLTDDDSAQRQTIRMKWTNIVLLLCIFHYLQATWRRLWDSKT